MKGGEEEQKESKYFKREKEKLRLGDLGRMYEEKKEDAENDGNKDGNRDDVDLEALAKEGINISWAGSNKEGEETNKEEDNQIELPEGEASVSGVEAVINDRILNEPIEINEKMPDRPLDGDVVKEEKSQSEGDEEKQSREEKLRYLATRVIDDLIRLYGENAVEVSQAGEKLKKYGIEPLYYHKTIQGKEGDQHLLLMDKKKGLNMTNMLINYFALDSGEPQGWTDWKTPLEKSGFNLEDLKEARNLWIEIQKKRKEKRKVEKVKDERFALYQKYGSDLLKVSKMPPVIDNYDGNNEKFNKDFAEYNNQKEAAINRLREFFPRLEDLIKDQRSQIYWAARVLTDGWKPKENRWGSEKGALDFLDKLSERTVKEEAQEVETDLKKIQEEQKEVNTVEEEKQDERFKNVPVNEIGEIRKYDGIESDIRLVMIPIFRTTKSYEKVKSRLEKQGVNVEALISGTK